jgi:hypothetical protein
MQECLKKACQKPDGFCHRQTPDTGVEMSPIPMRAAASTRGNKPRLYCHRSTQYIVHCVGDASSIVFSTHCLAHVTWG